MLVDYIVNYVQIYIQNFLKLINVIFERKNNEITGAREPKIFTQLTPHYKQWEITSARNIILFRPAVKRGLDFLAIN
jgi:hypothetical protein